MSSAKFLRRGSVLAFGDDTLWGDRAIFAAHGCVCALIAILYGLSPRPKDLVAQGLDGVWLFIGAFGAMTLLRGWIARKRALRPIEAGIATFIEFFLFYQLVWSFQDRYQHAPELLLKTPALVFSFVLLSVQLVRFDLRQILIAGSAAVLGWAVLVIGVINEAAPGAITRAYVDYLAGPKILIGAAVEHAAILAFVTGALALAVYRGQMLHLREVEARRQAELAGRVKTQFITNMSHELRTPLNAIIGYSEMITEELSAMDQKGMASDCARIQASGKNLLSMVSQILDLSGDDALDAVSFAPVDVAAMARDVLVLVSTAAARNRVALKLTVSPGLELLLSNEAKLQQCLHNLLGNAVKFTHDGSVELIIEREILAGGNKILFRVRDTGIGIAKDMLDLVFEPFAQGDVSLTRRYGGAGLGLALTRKLAAQLGGEVSAESEPGKGSTFTLSVPEKPKHAG